MKIKKKWLASILWISVYLIVIDISINILFRYPKDPRVTSVSTIKQFFEFGRSVEGKLSRMTRRIGDESAPIMPYGWLDNALNRTVSENTDIGNKSVISVYGMSHADLLAEDMAKIDNSFEIRSITAPGAVPTWSYSAYIYEKERKYSEVVILGIMTRGITFINTTSGATNHFEAVYPYTYPRYFLNNGNLEYVMPPFVSFQGYLGYFFDSNKWADYIKWLEQYDKYYDPLLFRKTFLDGSSIFRLLRRAYAYSSRGKKEADVYNSSKGFNTESNEVQVLKAIVVEFSKTAKRNNSLPIIYIVNNVYMGDRLYRILEPTLLANNILFLSSHLICPPNDPRLFLPDSHFIPSKNIEMAKEMIRIIKENIKYRGRMIYRNN
jgi:hypothetical protein